MTTRFRTREILLGCGVLSVLVYVAADVIGGLTYPGYSFISQAVSELMATGAPSERLVDPLFLLYGVLSLAFAAGILRDAGQSRALRATALLLLAYAIIGFTGPTLFEIHPRGAGKVGEDMPHIIVTAMLVVLTLAAIGFAALAFGKRFRVYSVVTIVVMIGFGVLGGTLFGARLAAGQPTPGFGIVERVSIYASLLWMAALAVALLRRRGPSARRSAAAQTVSSAATDADLRVPEHAWH